ncbi:ABC transporter permease [Caenimonas aquaedulcis]|uniref:ABC transporter permease n=1 Tax=Caenimonas aquaedulcis TaxID=2793270 RepID=A0A931H3R8_9BURK|nr:ABC transporter permease [Caenimonas aquaedulcis]MBG9387982.1 ABC transporter permease [Caenimonas aquaedulcis]
MTTLASPRVDAPRRAVVGKRSRALYAAIFIVLMIASCAFIPFLLPWTDTQIDIVNRHLAPSFGVHPAGTDELGRDLLARLLVAGRISLSVGVAAMAMSVCIGVTLGLLAGFYSGWIGNAIMRMVDVALCFPNVFLMLTLSALLQPSVVTLIILIACTSWMEIARVVQAQVSSLREREFALAARSVGCKDAHLIFKVLLPNTMPTILVAATLNVAHAILAESYVSFLGYGVQPPTPSWGNMLNQAQGYLDSAPWMAILPGALITMTVLSFHFLGEGVLDLFDVRSRKR